MKIVKRLFIPLIAPAVLMIASTSQANVETTPVPQQQSVQSATEKQTDDMGIQLADEIIRRIRRLGINVIRFPNTRPSETVGEIC